MKRIIIVLTSIFLACGEDNDGRPSIEGVDFRQEMREFVINISEYAKSKEAGFVVIPQNGIELITNDAEPDGPVNAAYLAAIDGHGQEDLFYGYDEDDQATPTDESDYLLDFLDVSKSTGNTILVTDYCSTPSNMDDSYSKSEANGYISFAADERDLFSVPIYPDPIHNENDNEIHSLSQVQNFLYLINPETFASKSDLIASVQATNYDLIIMDLFFEDDTEFSAAEIEMLRSKANDGKRLVICYMSIGEAEDYRYYWDVDWKANSPEWMEAQNPDWEGNYKVRYWDQGWQQVIFGSEEAYLDKILVAGFDGVYLDIIDGYEYFE